MKGLLVFIRMRYHFVLQYGWFLQNLGKDFIPTNMHTTVRSYCSNVYTVYLEKNTTKALLWLRTALHQETGLLLCVGAPECQKIGGPTLCSVVIYLPLLKMREID